MKQPTFNGRELLLLSVIDAARSGDAEAMEQVLRYYEGNIFKLCTRTLYDEDGYGFSSAFNRQAYRINITVFWWAVFSCLLISIPSEPALSLAEFLDADQFRPLCCLSKAAATYTDLLIIEDNLLKKASTVIGTLTSRM